ncbi:MAG TPA: peptidylprolyl isomerase [Candidatus Acidoferrum sp.]|jgi:peptidyl-prolyl cis-trans isomerase SurA|nr:peptidylprolyl isomerase [Candidatus Acidoferrum sp.]
MRKLAVIAALGAALPLASAAVPAQEKPAAASPQSKTPAPATQKPPVAPAAKRAEGANGRTVEEIIARVNNEIITRSDYERARASAEEDAKQECAGRCTPEQLQVDIENRQKNVLRDLIDQSLLVQRGKDMGVSVEPEVIKKLDQIRIQNNLASMEDLEKAVSSQGVNWEDFKNNIRSGILTQRVISSEVGSHITIAKDEVKKYYDEHQKDFIRPEQVALREIEIATEGKKESEIPDLKKKAETALQRVKDGEDFGEIAKRLSDGSTAKQGGFLGVYKRGELSKQLEDVVFKMKKNELTDVMDTKQGYLILQVMEHYDEGMQPLNKVENEITEKLYSARMEPALRDYLKTLREQSYVVIKPGYQDMAGGGNSEIQEVSATPEVSKSKKGHKKYLLFGKRSGASS